MKRAAILLCLLLLTGCGSDAVPAIEEEAWQMTTVQSTADNGAIIACAPGEPGAPAHGRAAHAGLHGVGRGAHADRRDQRPAVCGKLPA